MIDWNKTEEGKIYCTKCGAECKDNRCPNCDISKDTEIRQLKQRLNRARERIKDLIQHFTDELTCRVTDIDMAEEEGWEYPDGENGYHVEWHGGQRDMARDIVKRLQALAELSQGE